MMLNKEELQNMLYVSIISSDNDKYTEEAKQKVISRYKKEKERGEATDWKYVLEPVDKNGKLAALFE